MTNGDEKLPPFDPVAAAESMLQDVNSEAYESTPEEVAMDHAESERQRPLVEALAEKGIQLDLAKGELIVDKLMEATVEVERLRAQMDSLSARILAGDRRAENDEAFSKLQDRMNDSLRKGEMADIAEYIDNLTYDDTIDFIDRVESVITTITVSKHLDPAEKQAYLDVLKSVSGEESFFRAKERLRGGRLEEALGKVGAQEAQDAALAQEYQYLQATLIQRLGIGNINHEDWVPFTQHLHQAIQFQRTATPEATIMLASLRPRLQKLAGRLGISSDRLTAIFTHFGIEGMQG